MTFNQKKSDDILNQYIKPAVAADGGEISLNYYKDNIVCVDLKGACKLNYLVSGSFFRARDQAYNL